MFFLSLVKSEKGTETYRETYKTVTETNSLCLFKFQTKITNRFILEKELSLYVLSEVFLPGMFNPHGNSPFSCSEGFTNFHLGNLRFFLFWSQNSNPYGNSPFSRSEGFICHNSKTLFFLQYLEKTREAFSKKKDCS